MKSHILRLTPTVDALINNAAMYAKKRKLTAGGFESTMAVNHFAPFLLALSLLPQLVAAENARVVTVSSIRDGARISLYLTTSAKVASITGKYFVDCLEQSSSATSRDAHLAAALWAISRHSLATYL